MYDLSGRAFNGLRQSILANRQRAFATGEIIMWKLALAGIASLAIAGAVDAQTTGSSGGSSNMGTGSPSGMSSSSGMSGASGMSSASGTRAHSGSSHRAHARTKSHGANTSSGGMTNSTSPQ